MEDECKLFYVAVTRAKQNLYMTYELSTQLASCFVKEAAESDHLKIDRTDLTYQPKANRDERGASYGSEVGASDAEREEARRQRQEYWEAVKYARSQLYDYYGTGAHFCPAMYSVLGEVKDWSSEQILAEAARNGLI